MDLAIVIARNEGTTLRHTLHKLSELQQIGLLGGTIVVNDFSSDRGVTQRIAHEFGAAIVNNPSHLGKRGSFVNGIVKANELGAKNVLVLNSDIVELPTNTVRRMLDLVRENRCDMVTAQQLELLAGGSYYPIENSEANAQRAIRMEALKPLLGKDALWVKLLLSKTDKHKWGLERALDLLIQRRLRIEETITTMPAFRLMTKELTPAQKRRRTITHVRQLLSDEYVAKLFSRRKTITRHAR